MGIERQPVHSETLDQRAKRYVEAFTFSRERQLELGQGIKRDVVRCKRHHKNTANEPKGEMLFLDTCVDKPPTGKEKGVFYAVDFGGTNLRVVRVELDGSGAYKESSCTRNIKEVPSPHPKGLMDAAATASELFDAVADLVKEAMEASGDVKSTTLFPIGFTFSFATLQTDIDSAQCLRMGKEFATGSATNDPVACPGTDIVLLLNRALERKKIPGCVTAILNDTTGTLISGAYLMKPNSPQCMLGLIIGTGLNACYVDPEAVNFGYFGSVINTELGAVASCLPYNIVDHEVDDADLNPGSQRLEKMCSGLYIPEMCRRAILKVFQKRAPKLAWTRYSLSTEACMAMAYDKEAEKFSKVKEVLLNQLDWNEKDLNIDDLRVVHQLCEAILLRACQIIAVAVASLAFFTGRLQPAVGGLSCAVDGSLYTQNPEFQENLHQALKDYLGESLAKLIHLTIARDGSGLGAGILAAMPNRKRKSSFSYSPQAIWDIRQAEDKQQQTA